MVKKQKTKCKHDFANSCNSGAIYCFGFLGAAVYYISHATGFWNIALAVLKAIVWPAFLVYEALKFLGT